MIQANELRIGNLVNRVLLHSEKVEKISEIKPIDFHTELQVGDAIGIPLTGEWLVNFDFEYVENGEYAHEKLGCFYIWFNSRPGIQKWEISPNSDWPYNSETPINYVHQLQNLYFALTGEELKIK